MEYQQNQLGAELSERETGVSRHPGGEFRARLKLLGSSQHYRIGGFEVDP